MTTLGHNSGFAAGQLKTLVERIERLEEEKSAIADDIKEVYAEAKGQGFDAAILRKCIALRKMDPAKRQEMESVLELYMAAIFGEERKETEKSYAEAK